MRPGKRGLPGFRDFMGDDAGTRDKFPISTFPFSLSLIVVDSEY